MSSCPPERCPHCVGHSLPLCGPSVEHRHHPPDGTLQSPVERGGGGGGEKVRGGRREKREGERGRERDFLF